MGGGVVPVPGARPAGPNGPRAVDQEVRRREARTVCSRDLSRGVNPGGEGQLELTHVRAFTQSGDSERLIPITFKPFRRFACQSASRERNSLRQ